MTDWIPVTERLPETAAACWVAIEMRYEVITRLAYCERSGNWQHIDARPILSPSSLGSPSSSRRRTSREYLHHLPRTSGRSAGSKQSEP